MDRARSSGVPRPIIARFLRYEDREEVMQKARAKLKGKDYAVFKDIPKERLKNYTNLEKSSRISLNAQGKMVLKRFSVKNSRTSCLLTVNLDH